MKKYLKKKIAYVFLAACFVLCLGGCSKKAPESLEITIDGEKVEVLDMMNGNEQTGITLEISPADYEGDIVWTTEDAGMLKLSSINGNVCAVLAKKTGSTKITAECGGASVSIRVHIEKDQNNLTAYDTAMTIDGAAYSSEVCDIYFSQAYYYFAEDYADAAASYGLDLSLGIESLADQACDYSDDGTWYGYFLTYSLSQIMQVQTLCNYADENGISLNDDQLAEVEEAMTGVEDKAAENGYTDLDAYVNDFYGNGCTADMLRTYFERTKLSEIVYNSYKENLTYTDEELAAHYVEMGYEEGTNEYPVTSMRHILIMAEEDENGEYTDEAIEAAHAKIEAINEEWLSGEQTEERFAELANEYSEDGGSNTVGGLYEEIYEGQMIEGINTWLFTEEREVGDTTIVDNNGSYVGSHLVYFVGYGDDYCDVLALEDLKETALTAWYDELMGNVEAIEGLEYSQIGKNY